jgi:chitodextrinase
VVYWDLLVAVGDTGIAGPQGAQGATGASGLAGLTNRGAWSSTVTYTVGDVVYYSGSSYSGKTSANVNNTPNTSVANWDLMVSQGQIGIQGATGLQGIQGATGLQGIQGPQGAPGAQGVAGTQGATGLQGIPGLSNKGVWVTTTTYDVGDVVSLTGSSYVSRVVSNIGHNPGSDIVNWGVLASVGTAGPTGPQGSTGLQGAVGFQGNQGIQGIKGVDGTAAFHAYTHAIGGIDPMSASQIGALPIAGGTLTGNLIINGTVVWNNAFATQADFPPATGLEEHGMIVHSHADGKMFFAHGGAWVALANESVLALPYDIPFFVYGVPAVNTLVGLMLAPRDISLFSGLTGSMAKSKVASTSATSFLIKMSGTQIGTVDFAAGSTVATFTFASSVKVTSGSFLEIYTGALVDSTLSNIAITLVGSSLAPTGVVLP